LTFVEIPPQLILVLKNTSLNGKLLLLQLGIVNLFGPMADLSGVGKFNNYSPRVSSAIHSAMLSIDEQGGVAAASTAFAAVALSNDDPLWTFVANRPFIAVLWDNDISAPLFMAKIVDPAS
jgi:serine protease inhibitor